MKASEVNRPSLSSALSSCGTSAHTQQRVGTISSSPGGLSSSSLSGSCHIPTLAGLMKSREGIESLSTASSSRTSGMSMSLASTRFLAIVHVMLYTTHTESSVITGQKATVKVAYEAFDPDEITVQVGDVVDVINKVTEDEGWWKVHVTIARWEHINHNIHCMRVVPLGPTW